VRRSLLVTGHAYRRMLKLPAFWIVSLIVPVFVLVAPAAEKFLGKTKTAAYVLVDKSGRYQAAIHRRLELDYQRQVLVQLMAYVEEWRASGPTPGAQAVAQMGSSSSDGVVADFVDAGGAPALLQKLKPKLLASAPPFQPPARPLVEIPIPTGVHAETADQFGASIGPHFQESSKTAAGNAGLALAVYIPGDVDSGGRVHVWTDGQGGADLVQDLKIELTQGLRQRALQAAGVNPLSAAQIESPNVSIAIAPPETTAPGGKARVHSALPLVLAYLLLVSMMITGSMMLQGLVEERSNKLLEAVLACVSPRELMVGKLIGISALGLSIIAIWISVALTIAKVQPSSPLRFLMPALASLWQSPWIAMAMLFYFLAGFLTIGMIFLGVGLVSDSMQEAQTYLMPLMLVVVFPSALLASAILRDPNGLIPRIFSWIPIYAPVTMLARLQSGVSRFDLVGTAAVLLAFGIMESFVLGRLFENNLIQTGHGFRLTGSKRRALVAGLAVVVAAAAFAVRHGRTPTRSGGELSAVTTATNPPPCSKQAAFSIAAGDWSGWSIDPRNWRFQPGPGLTTAEIPGLKVKWAFSYPGGKYGQPTLVGGRVFLTSTGGAIYSLDAKTGCLYWRFAQSARSRTTISIGPLPGVAPSGYAAYFGDMRANVYAVDAASGALLWKTRVDSHPRAILTGAPTLFKDWLYVPVSSDEEGTASLASYSCCTFRGSVVALRAATGEIRWKAFSIDRPPGPTVKNSAGTQMYGPAGGAVWSSPTVDAKRDRLYFTTGNSYTDVKEGGSDAVVAVDLASGRTIWKRETIKNDDDLSGCQPGRNLVNCPPTPGPDYDFGASPILAPLSNGKEILVAGQKSGVVFGIDADSGEILWSTHVGVGGFLGGVLWGMASDGHVLYVANSDVLMENGRPGLFALDLATGKDLWYTPSPKVGCGWTSGAPCFNSQSAAPFAIPGVIFAGTTDGHERAYTATDGRIFWDFDSARGTYHTVNGDDGQAGGSIDVSSGSLANGMLYLISGYRGILGGGSNDVLLAFSVDGR
jgi:polyvinyl alcohol dehydrogenase (cytochrome)